MKQFRIAENELNKVLEYLGGCRYVEVAPIINMLLKIAEKEIPVLEEVKNV